MNRICLILIVKDEAPVIKRCLLALKPWVTSWCIVDTGSTDNTMEIIRSTMDGVPGELHQREAVREEESGNLNFSHHRTEVMQLARARGDADYLLMIDADDTWRAADDFRWPDLERHDAWEVQLRMTTDSWSRIQLTRADQDWLYKAIGGAHEFLVGPRGYSLGLIRGAVIRCGNDGARRRTEPVRKYERVATQLEAYLEDHPDDPRTLFYCAQSHRDAGQRERALELYQRRATVGGWEEERYIAFLEIARLRNKLGHPWEDVERCFLTAYEYRPSRAVPLLEIAQHYRKEGRYPLAHMYACAAADMPRPPDSLYVDEPLYEWEALDEYAVTASWVGRHHFAAAAARRLLATRTIPKAPRKRIRENLQTYERPLAKSPVIYGDRVTVAMSTYRCPDPKALRESVESILAQTYENLLVVLVSDGDETPPWDALEGLVENDPRLVLIHNPVNRGQFFCHELVRGATPDKMMTVQDDDDVSLPHRIETLVQQMERSHADVVFSGLKRVDGGEGLEPLSARTSAGWEALTGVVTRPNLGILGIESLETFIHIGSHVGLFRTEAIAKVGGYYGGFRLGYDTMLGMAVSRLGRPDGLQEVLYLYRQSDESMTGSRDTGFRSRKRVQSIRKMIGLWEKAVRSTDPAQELHELLEYNTPVEHTQELRLMSQEVSAVLPRPPELPRLPDLHDHLAYGSKIPDAFEGIDDLRNAYIVQVSTRKDMSMSVHIALMACAMCKALGLKNVLDLGSGFSSAALRRFTEANVCTVDHDAVWLEKSREFARKRADDRGDWLTWDDFLAGSHGPFDLVINDLGGLQRRVDSFEVIWETIRPGGFLIIDDMHKADFRRGMVDALQNVEHVRYDIQRETLDEFKRYAYLVQRPIETETREE